MNLRRGKPLIVRCLFVPRRFCVNIFGLILTRDSSWIDSDIINHERIHTAQMRELIFVPFYILYFLEWLVKLLQHRQWYTAYKNISFEREAYAHGHDHTYLAQRRHFAQWRTRNNRDS